MAVATLTSKGQITVPVSVRERLGLKPGDRIDFVLDRDGRLSLEPKRTGFETLRGILKHPKGRAVTVRAMDRAVGDAVVSRWRRSTAGARR